MAEEIPFRELFEKAANDHLVPVGILIELVRNESAFDSDAIGDGGMARGLGQFWEATWNQEGIGEGTWDNAYDPGYAIPAIARYLAWLWRVLQRGSWTLCLLSYNWGIGNTLSWLRRGYPIPPSMTLRYAKRILKGAGAFGAF